MLDEMPDTSYYYGNSHKKEKKNTKLTAWHRKTPYWNIECEWSGELNRTSALEFYA
jgi:hypothetical protein